MCCFQPIIHVQLTYFNFFSYLLQLDKASTGEDVDAIVPEYLEIINGSGWPCTIDLYNTGSRIQ